MFDLSSACQAAVRKSDNQVYGINKQTRSIVVTNITDSDLGIWWR